MARGLSTLLSAGSSALLAVTVAAMATGGFGRVAVARVVSEHWPDDEMARESVRGVVLSGRSVVVGGTNWGNSIPPDLPSDAPPRAPVTRAVRWVTAPELAWPNRALWEQPDQWWFGADGFVVSTGSMTYGVGLWQVPLWAVALAFGVLPSVRLVRWFRRGRRPAGCCQACGYDLRATPEPGRTLLDRCPECGRVPAVTTRLSRRRRSAVPGDTAPARPEPR